MREMKSKDRISQNIMHLYTFLYTEKGKTKGRAVQIANTLTSRKLICSSQVHYEEDLTFVCNLSN